MVLVSIPGSLPIETPVPEVVDKTTLSYILAEISASNSKFGSATLIPILSSCASITNRLVSNATSFAKVETSVVSPVTVNVPEISRSFEN